MSTLLLFEYLDEIERFISSHGRQKLSGNGTSILALRPEIQAYLKGLGNSYLTSLDFFDRESHENLLVKSDEIVQSFRRSIAIEDDMGVKEGYNNAFLFYVRCFVHYMLFLIEVIDRCAEDLKITHMVSPDYREGFDSKPLIDSKYRYLWEICELICDRRNISPDRFDVVAHEKKKKRPIFMAERAEGLTKKLAFGVSLRLLARLSRKRNTILSSSKDYGISVLMEEMHKSDRDIFVFYLTSRNKWMDFRSSVRAKWVGNLFTLPDSSHPSQKGTFVKCLNQNVDRLERLVGEKPDLVKYRKIDFSKQVFQRIRLSLLPFLVNLYGKTISLNRVLHRCRPRMILVPHSREITYNLGELAKQNGIPALLVSHGSHVPPRNKYERIEWSEHGRGLMNTHYDYVAIQTPWAEAYLDEITTQSKRFITGPLLFGRQIIKKGTKAELRKNFLSGREDQFVILNASTPKTREVMRFYVYETVDEYVSNTNDLIEAVEGLENAYLVVRFRPLPDLNEKDFARLLRPGDRYGIHSDGAFGDYLFASDVLVSYSSTAIEEALQNNVPVLQYDPQGKYCHIPGTLLKPDHENRVDSCYFVDSRDNLCWALKWVEVHHCRKEPPKGIYDRHRFKEEEITSPQELYKRMALRSWLSQNSSNRST